MRSINPDKVNTNFRTKVALAVFGFLLFFVLLEAGLRMAGFIILSTQEYRNLQSLRQKGSYRIMCIGESTTAGQYPAFLEEILNRSNIGVKFSVINKGVSATNTTSILAGLESNINNYHPDMVIAMMGVNDSGVYVPRGAGMGSRIALFLRSFRVYKLARLIWLHALAKIEETRGYLVNDRLNELRCKIITVEESLKRSLRLFPGDCGAYLNLGIFYRDQGRFAQAGDAFKAATELSPRNDRVYIELGWLYRKEEKFSQAESCWKKAIELNPKSEPAYNALGWLYHKQGRFIESEKALQTVLRLNSKNYRAYLELGKLYGKQGKFIQAEESFKKAIELNPKNINARVDFGRFYQDQGRFAQAAEAFNKVLELNPRNDCARAAMPVILRKIGKTELAEQYIKEARRLHFEYYKSVTVNNLRRLKEILDDKGIRFVCMQYPMRGIEPLRMVFEGNERGIIFVDNEKVFKNAVSRGGQARYFRDMFGGDFGHCTSTGNRLLAKNAANIILREVFHR